MKKHKKGFIKYFTLFLIFTFIISIIGTGIVAFISTVENTSTINNEK